MLVSRDKLFGKLKKEPWESPDVHLDEIEVKPYSDKFRMRHVQLTDRIKEQVKIWREETDRGFTQGRSMQCIARIPALVFLNLPKEIREDEKALSKWLNQTEEGQTWKIAKGA